MMVHKRKILGLSRGKKKINTKLQKRTFVLLVAQCKMPTGNEAADDSEESLSVSVPADWPLNGTAVKAPTRAESLPQGGSGGGLVSRASTLNTVLSVPPPFLVKLLASL